MASNPACLFCRIVKREIPAKVLFETEHCSSFLSAVDHVHFHVIPKPSEDEGLVMGWKVKDTTPEKLEALRKTYLKL
ncbi:Adenosine 5'-monophosphoramidase [Dissophora ornata]|nr:Adenosine 5'-monophosphoramidase [Dissophora ornata]